MSPFMPFCIIGLALKLKFTEKITVDSHQTFSIKHIIW